MLIFVFDTSIHHGTIGWAQVEQADAGPAIVDYAHSFLPAKPGHAEQMLSRIEDVLASGGFTVDSPDLLVVGQGPGTFTGLRIGFAVAKSLHLSTGVPLVGVSSLEMMAVSARLTGTVVVLMDARRKELYMGCYDVAFVEGRFQATSMLSPQTVKPDAVAVVLKENGIDPAATKAIGDGAHFYAAQLTSEVPIMPFVGSRLEAASMALAGYARFHQDGADDASVIEPVYLRAPDAKKPNLPVRNIE